MNNIYKCIGAQIKFNRKEKGLSLKDLAKKVGFPYSTMANIESGTRKITMKQLDGISRVLDLPISEMLDITVFEGLKEYEELKKECKVLIDEYFVFEEERKQIKEDHINGAIEEFLRDRGINNIVPTGEKEYLNNLIKSMLDSAAKELEARYK